jgi:hypothetical protein
VLKAMKSVLGGRRGERQSLLGAGSSDDGAGEGGLSDGLSSSQLSDQVEGARMAGRRAAAQGDAIGSTRRQDALSGVREMGMAGLEMGLDAAVPGLGYGLGAASSAMAIRDARKQGDSMGAATIGEGARTAAGFIPVVGEFVGFVDGVVQVATATFQSDKARTEGKIGQAREILGNADAWLGRLPALREQVLASGDAAQLARLDKAEARLRASVRQTEAWIAKKSDRGTMPLLAGLSDEGNTDARPGASDEA